MNPASGRSDVGEVANVHPAGVTHSSAVPVTPLNVADTVVRPSWRLVTCPLALTDAIAESATLHTASCVASPASRPLLRWYLALRATDFPTGKLGDAAPRAIATLSIGYTVTVKLNATD
jgi:hypothetical protein